MPSHSAYDDGGKAFSSTTRSKWRMSVRPKATATDNLHMMKGEKKESLAKLVGAKMGKTAAGCKDKPPHGLNSASVSDVGVGAKVGKTARQLGESSLIFPEPGSDHVRSRSGQSETCISSSTHGGYSIRPNSTTLEQLTKSPPARIGATENPAASPFTSASTFGIADKRKSKYNLFSLSKRQGGKDASSSTNVQLDPPSIATPSMVCSPPQTSLALGELSGPSAMFTTGALSAFAQSDHVLAPPQPAFLRDSTARRGSASSQHSGRTSMDTISVHSNGSGSPSLHSTSSLATACLSYDATDHEGCSYDASRDHQYLSSASTPKLSADQGSTFWKGLKRRLPGALSNSPKSTRDLRSGESSRKTTNPFKTGALAPIDLTPQLPLVSRRSTFDLDNAVHRERTTSIGAKSAGASLSVAALRDEVTLIMRATDTEALRAANASTSRARDELSDTSEEDDYGADDPTRDAASIYETSALTSSTDHAGHPSSLVSPATSEEDNDRLSGKHDDRADAVTPKQQNVQDQSTPVQRVYSEASVQAGVEYVKPTSGDDDIAEAQKIVYACTILKMFPNVGKTASQTADKNRLPTKQPRSMNKVKDVATRAKSAGLNRDLRTTVALAQTARRFDDAIMTSLQIGEVTALAAKHPTLTDAALQESLAQEGLIEKALSASVNCFVVTGKEAKERPPLGQSMGLWLSRPPFASRVHNVVSADVAVAPLPEIDPETGEVIQEKPRRARPQPLQFSMRCRALAIIGAGLSVSYAGPSLLQPRCSSMIRRPSPPSRSASIPQARTPSTSPPMPSSPEPRVTIKETRFADVAPTEESDNSSDDEVPLALLSAKYAAMPCQSAQRDDEERRWQAQRKLAEQRKKQQLEQTQLAEHKRSLAEARARRQRTEHSMVLNSPTYGAGSPLFDSRRKRRDQLAVSMYEPGSADLHRYYGMTNAPLPPPSTASAIEINARLPSTSTDAIHRIRRTQREARESQTSIASSKSEKRLSQVSSRSRTKLSGPPTTPKTPSPLHSSTVINSAPAKSTGFAREADVGSPSPLRNAAHRVSRIAAPKPVYNRHSMVAGHTPHSEVSYSPHAVPMTSSPLADVTHYLNKSSALKRTSRISGSKLHSSRMSSSASVDVSPY